VGWTKLVKGVNRRHFKILSHYTILNKAINSFWYDKWTNEEQIKSTLEYLEIQQNPIGTF
jgi:hypothetical protein